MDQLPLLLRLSTLNRATRVSKAVKREPGFEEFRSGESFYSRRQKTLRCLQSDSLEYHYVSGLLDYTILIERRASFSEIFPRAPFRLEWKAS